MYVGSNFRAVTLEDVKIFVNKNYMKMDREELEFSLDEVCLSWCYCSEYIVN